MTWQQAARRARYEGLLRAREAVTAQIADARARHVSVARLYERQRRILRELLELEAVI